MRTEEAPRIVGVETNTIRPALLRAGAACRYASIANSTLKRLEAAGELPVVQISRHKLYRIADLDAVIARAMKGLVLKGGKERKKQLGRYA